MVITMTMKGAISQIPQHRKPEGDLLRQHNIQDSTQTPSSIDMAHYPKTRQQQWSRVGRILLTVVYRPPRERNVDIVFVHGLGGSSRMTWAKHRDLDRCWPLSFLPSEPGMGDVRILTFGYNSKFKPGAEKNQASVLDFAKDLLYDLKHAQDESGFGLEDLGMGEASSYLVLQRLYAN